MASKSNLQRFLERTTPVVASQSLNKTACGYLNPLWCSLDSEKVECFALRDLWGCYEEWSTYGAGTQVALKNDEERLVQYYVPYLSAIQIYTSSRCLAALRNPREDVGAIEVRESVDSYSEDSESDKLCRSDATTTSEDCSSDQDGLWHLSDRLGHLYCQYFEMSPPSARLPLVGKINELAQEFPGLMTLRSVDLSPASWMAVAWYPIYHIPRSSLVKELLACFLTYHTLSSSFQDPEVEGDIEFRERRCKDTKCIALPPFGLATYKMRGSIWDSGTDKLLSLSSAADSWLKQLRVNHYDYNFFNRIYHNFR